MLSIYLANAIYGERLPRVDMFELTAALCKSFANPFAQSILCNKIFFLLFAQGFLLLAFHCSLFGFLASSILHWSMELSYSFLVSKAYLSHVEDALAHLVAYGLE